MRARKVKYKRGDMVLYTYTDSYKRTGMFILHIDGSMNDYYKLRVLKTLRGNFDDFLGTNTPRDHIENYSKRLARDLNTEMVEAIYG